MDARERVNILLVDDQPGKLLTYEATLAELDETLLKAASAREAFEILLKTEVAVVLVDVCMPDLDGFELAAMIREHPRCRSTSIILISAVLVNDDDRLRGFSSGATDYLPVPVVPEILRAKVGVFVELFRKKRELEALNRELEARVRERTAALEASTKRLRESEAELQESGRRKDEFLAILAHELRNPMAPVRNAAEILKLRGDLDPEIAWNVGVIARQVTHLTRLIDDLLDISRINCGRLELRRSRVTLAAIVDSALEISRPLIEQYEHILTLELPTQPIYLDADQVRLAQVFMNLLNNSAKYTPKGGRIGLSAALETGTAQSAPAVVVTVRDSGIGIAPDKLANLFQMFVQIDSQNRRTESGLGIGLALVRSLVEMHGGRIEARSDGPGLGSEFTVRLPVVSVGGRDGVAEAEAETVATAQGGARRILVVDDHPDNVASLAILLRRLGHEVEIANGGREALAAADRFRPGVVLLDIGMPDIDGYEVCRALRERPWAASATLIALTGWGQQRDRMRSAEAGFDAHLVKPLDYGELERLLSGLNPPGGASRTGAGGRLRPD
jgi:signal transduction histidine kinase